MYLIFSDDPHLSSIPHPNLGVGKNKSFNIDGRSHEAINRCTTKKIGNSNVIPEVFGSSPVVNPVTQKPVGPKFATATAEGIFVLYNIFRLLPVVKHFYRVHHFLPLQKLSQTNSKCVLPLKRWCSCRGVNPLSTHLKTSNRVMMCEIT